MHPLPQTPVTPVAGLHLSPMSQIISKACIGAISGGKYFSKSDQCALAAALEAEPICHMKIMAQRVLNSHSHASDILSNGTRPTCSLCRAGDFICHAYSCLLGNCDRVGPYNVKPCLSI